VTTAYTGAVRSRYSGLSVCVGGNKAHGAYSSFSVPGGACQKAGEGLFTRVCSDRTRGNSSKLKEGRFT